jgi:hypothetical protein
MDGTAKDAPPPTLWKTRYADRHRLVRITDFPGRIKPPKRI